MENKTTNASWYKNYYDNDYISWPTATWPYTIDPLYSEKKELLDKVNQILEKLLEML